MSCIKHSPLICRRPDENDTLIKLRACLLGVVLMLFAADDIIAQTASADTAAITAAVDGFHDALAHGDAAAAMGLLAPDATILESGASQTREEYAREHLAEDIAFTKATSSSRSSLIVRQEGDVAWTTSTFRTSGSFGGKPVDSIAAELVVLTRTPDGWQIRAIHWSSHTITKSK